MRRRQWHPTPVLLPGKSHGWRSLVGCSPWGREESDTTERLHFHFSLSCIGEGNGNPLQCSCLENPRDGGAQWAAVYGVAQSRTWLKQLSSSSSIWMSYRRKKQLFLRFGKAVGKERWVQRTRLCTYFKAKETKISHTHTHLRITSWGTYCCYPTLTMKKLKLKTVKLLTRGQSEWQIQPDTDNTSLAQAVSLALYGLLTRQMHRTMKNTATKIFL